MKGTARCLKRMIAPTFMRCLLLAALASQALGAQNDSTLVVHAKDSVFAASGVPVIFAGDTLFRVYSPLGEFVASERAEQVVRKLRMLARNDRPLDSLVMVDHDGVTDVLLDSMRVFSVTPEDALTLGKERVVAAGEYRSIILKAVNLRRSDLSIRSLLIDTGLIAAALLIAFVVFWVARFLFPRLYKRLEQWERINVPPVTFRGHVVVSRTGITSVLIVALKGLRLIVSLILLYYLILFVLDTIPWTRTWDPAPILQGILYTILATVIAVGLIRVGGQFWKKLSSAIDGWKGTYINPVKIKNVEVLSAERIMEVLHGSMTVFRFVFFIFVGYFYVTLVFSFFAFSATWASTLFGYVLNPLKQLVVSFINYLPNVFFIVVTVTVTRYALKFIHLIFREVRKGTISIPGFYPEWSDPTYKITRFLVIAFAAVVVFPYLPGSDSPAFQGISVFLGILFSFGSTSAIANVVAGVVLTYMRPFKVGERVKIADTVGDVVEKTLLVTRVRTIKNVDVTIPNSMVLGSHIINFSSSADDPGLILHTTVTIGYDVPWETVHSLLLKAALATKDVLKDPPAFVLQSSLDDFFVSYELNAFTNAPSRMAATYSELHQRIQDQFNEAGVEIMSPHYTSVRDGNQSTVPESHLPKSYKAPSFRIFPAGLWPSTEKESSSPEKGKDKTD